MSTPTHASPTIAAIDHRPGLSQTGARDRLEAAWRPLAGRLVELARD